MPTFINGNRTDETSLNAPSGTTADIKINGTTYARLSATGGLSVGSTYVATDPGNNAIYTGIYYVGSLSQYTTSSATDMQFVNVAATPSAAGFDFRSTQTASDTTPVMRVGLVTGTQSAGRILQAHTNNGTELWAVNFDGGMLAGSGDASATPSGGYVYGPSSRGGTDTNVGGGVVTIKSGLGTGNAAAAYVSLKGSIPAGSGSTAQTYGESLRALGNNIQLMAGEVHHVTTPGAGAYNALVTDRYIRLPTQGAGITVTLPVSSNGQVYDIEAASDGGTHTITIAISGGTVNGTPTITTAYGRRTVRCDGTNAVAQ